MAATVTDDLTTVKDFENTTGVVSDNNVVSSVGSVSPIFFVEGSNSAIAQFKSSGVGGMGFQYGANQDWRQRHVMGWVNNLDVANTAANAGWRLRLESVGDSGGWGTNYGEWDCGGRDNRNVFVDRFLFLCADVMRPFDFSGGTLNRNAARTLGLVTNATSGSGQSTWFQDELKYGTGITVTAGTVGVPGVSADILSSDRSNGRGLFKDANGAFLVLGRITFGDNVGVTAAHFLDTDELWLIEDLPVANHFNQIEVVGNATGLTNNNFGTGSGTGVAREGSGGGVIKAAGAVPWQWTSEDANVDEHGCYGRTFIGPPDLRLDPLRNFLQEDNSGASFVDLTDEAADTTVNDAQPFPSGAGANDAAYFGSEIWPTSLSVNTGTAGAGTYTVTWEYYNGTAWSALTDVTDGTNAFKTTGAQDVTYSRPDDYIASTVSSLTRVWVRARRDGGTVTTNPDITQAQVRQGCNIRLDGGHNEHIRCNYINVESVRVRGGAFVKKSVFSGSSAGSKHAALDLGSADPAANTVRDLTISDNPGTNGILLKGTSTGTTTYNLRAISFANNLKDVRVDFPAGATVVINILESGTTPTIDNVNSSTVNVVANVNFTLTAVVTSPATTFTLAGDFVTDVPAGAFNGTGDSVVQLTANLPSGFPASGSVRLWNGTYFDAHTYTGISGAQMTGVSPTLKQDYNGAKALVEFTAPTTIAVDPYTISVPGSMNFEATLANASGSPVYEPQIINDNTSTGFSRRIAQIED